MQYIVENVLEQLSNERPVFHSEDDFKFALSKVFLDTLGSDFDIRLERPIDIKMVKRDGITFNTVSAPIDIIILNKATNQKIPIELKYKTKRSSIVHDNEQFNLKQHGAHDCGRFSFRKDIFRLERLIEVQEDMSEGYFIVISNDDKYINVDTSIKDTIDKHYSFHDGMTLSSKDIGWNHKSKKDNHWTDKGDYSYKLDLKKEYPIDWKIYSNVKDEAFFISIVRVKK